MSEAANDPRILLESRRAVAECVNFNWRVKRRDFKKKHCREEKAGGAARSDAERSDSSRLSSSLENRFFAFFAFFADCS